MSGLDGYRRTSSTASGCLSATRKSVRATGGMRRRFCSQLRKVAGLTPRNRANCGWESPSFLRTAFGGTIETAFSSPAKPVRTEKKEGAK